MTMALLCITTSRYQYQQLRVTAVAAVIMLEIMKDVQTGVKVQWKLSECESEFFVLFSLVFFFEIVYFLNIFVLSIWYFVVYSGLVKFHIQFGKYLLYSRRNSFQ